MCIRDRPRSVAVNQKLLRLEAKNLRDVLLELRFELESLLDVHGSLFENLAELGGLPLLLDLEHLAVLAELLDTVHQLVDLHRVRVAVP